MDIDFDFEKIKDEIKFRVYEAHENIIAVINFAVNHSSAPDKAKIAGALLYTYCDKMLGVLASQCSPTMSDKSKVDMPLASARAALMLEVLTMPAQDFRAKFDL